MCIQILLEMIPILLNENMVPLDHFYVLSLVLRYAFFLMSFMICIVKEVAVFIEFFKHCAYSYSLLLFGMKVVNVSGLEYFNGSTCF